MAGVIRLSVNVDHVATLREARRGHEPSPVFAALICANAGADGVTVHIRKDRRHIKEEDASLIKKLVNLPLTLEMGFFDDILRFALELRPHKVTLVPEEMHEITTASGLDLARRENIELVRKFWEKMKEAGIEVGVFIDPIPDHLDRIKFVDFVEINTTRYAEEPMNPTHLEAIRKTAKAASDMGLYVMGGHALNLHNVGKIASIPEISELSIGHSIVSRAIFVGLERAVREMKEEMMKSRMLERKV